MRRLVVVLTVLLSVIGARAQTDHLQCFKVKDSQAKTTYTADIAGLVLEPGCLVKVPAAMACVPATKTINGPPFPPGGGGTGTPNSFFCYKTKCPKMTLPTLAGADQFGSRTVMPSAAKLVCAPLASPSTTTTTTSTSTTTTLTCPPSPLPATGQTTCWDSSGTVIPCPGTGHDGDVQAGAALAYVDNADGTVTDVNTGLMWAKKSDDGSIHDKDTTYTWDNSFAVYVAALNTASFAGHNDWRMPNAKELQSIVNYQNAAPSVSPAFNTGCTPGCTVLTCSCTASLFYWSSTTYANALSGPQPAPQYAWFVNFDGGVVNAGYKGNGSFVRAVRGGA